MNKKVNMAEETKAIDMDKPAASSDKVDFEPILAVEIPICIEIAKVRSTINS
jgi:hypothetical protein